MSNFRIIFEKEKTTKLKQRMSCSPWASEASAETETRGIFKNFPFDLAKSTTLSLLFGSEEVDPDEELIAEEAEAQSLQSAASRPSLSKTFITSLLDCFSYWQKSGSQVNMLWKLMSEGVTLSGIELAEGVSPQQAFVAVLYDCFQLECIMSAKLYLRLLRFPGCTAYGVFSAQAFKSVSRLLGRNSRKNFPKESSLISLLKELKELCISSPLPGGIESTNIVIDTLVSNLTVVAGSSSTKKNDSKSELTKKFWEAALQLLSSMAATEKRNLDKMTRDINGHINEDICEEAEKYENDSNGSSLMGIFKNTVTSPTSKMVEQTSTSPSCVIYLLRRLIPVIVMTQGRNQTQVPAQVPANIKSFRDTAMLLSRYFASIYPTATAALIRHICVLVPPRSEYRKAACNAITELLIQLPMSNFVEPFCKFLYRFAHSKIIGNRLFAVELASMLVKLPVLWKQPNEKDEIVVLQVLELLVDRARDRAPSVRAQSLKGIAEILEYIGEEDKKVSKDMTDLSEEEVRAKAIHLRFLDGAKRTFGLVKDNDVSKTKSNASLTITLQRRLSDEKSIVRSAALRALGGLATCFGGALLSASVQCVEQDSKTLVQLATAVGVLCRDSSVSTRKQAIKTLSGLVAAAPEPRPSALFGTWLANVLPCATDGESTVQNLCADAVKKLIVNPIIAWHKQEVSKSKSNHANTNDEIWRMLKLLDANTQLISGLQKSIELLVKSGVINKAFIKALMFAAEIYTHNTKDTCVDAEENLKSVEQERSAWSILQEISRHPKLHKHIDDEFVMSRWSSLPAAPKPILVPVAQCVLSVLDNLASNSSISNSRANTLVTGLLQRMEKFTISVALVHDAVQAVLNLGERAPSNWAARVMDFCDTGLRNFIYRANDSEQLEDTSNNSTKCEVPSPRQLQVILAILGDVVLVDNGMVQGQGATGCANSARIKLGAVPKRIATSVQALLAPSLVIPATNKVIEVPMVVRALAFVALGKLCIRDASLAKRSIAVLVRELETAEEPALRNNILIVMGDLCRQHSALVDRYVPDMANCLTDEHITVRKHALMLLTELLLEHFVKWRGPLLFQYLSVFVDEEPELRELALHAMRNIFAARDQNLLPSCMVEAFFVFNDYTRHARYNNFSERERKCFQRFVGDAGSAKRRHIFASMLSCMNSEGKVRVTAMLCQEVLGGAVDCAFPLSDHTRAASNESPAITPRLSAHKKSLTSIHGDFGDFFLLQDTFAVLTCKEAHVTRKNITGEDSTESANNNQISSGDPALAIKAARDSLLSKMARKNAIKNVVPIVIALKQMFERSHSPLLKAVTNYFIYLFHNHRGEVDAVLREDRRLAQEVEFDLRRADAQMKEQQQRRKLRLQKEKERIKCLSSSKNGSTPMSEMSDGFTPGTNPRTPGSLLRSRGRSKSRRHATPGTAPRTSRTCPKTSQKELAAATFSVPKLSNNAQKISSSTSSNNRIEDDTEMSDITEVRRALEEVLSPVPPANNDQNCLGGSLLSVFSMGKSPVKEKSTRKSQQKRSRKNNLNLLKSPPLRHRRARKSENM